MRILFDSFAQKAIISVARSSSFRPGNPGGTLKFTEGVIFMLDQPGIKIVKSYYLTGFPAVQQPSAHGEERRVDNRQYLRRSRWNILFAPLLSSVGRSDREQTPTGLMLTHSITRRDETDLQSLIQYIHKSNNFIE